MGEITKKEKKMVRNLFIQGFEREKEGTAKAKKLSLQYVLGSKNSWRNQSHRKGDKKHLCTHHERKKEDK